MDSLTQMLLGSCVTASIVPANHQRTALMLGAVLGSVPDLDVLYFKLMGSDVVSEITWHRGPSHSLFVLLLLGWLLWCCLKKYLASVQQAPRAWLLAICLALLTHPLLDAFTVYGTQLLWPIPMPPVMWSSIYIIDPVYTLPLLVAVLVGWRLSKANLLPLLNAPARARTIRYWLLAALSLSSAYLAWSVVAKFQVEHIAELSLQKIGLDQAARFSTPMPFNTLLWRVVVIASDGYWIGDYSLIADKGAMRFSFYPSENQLLTQPLQSAQVKRLLWFSHGFVSINRQQAAVGQQQLILSDLRMGFEPNYFFRYHIAQQDLNGDWKTRVPITRLAVVYQVPKISWLWQRIFYADTVLNTSVQTRP
jgi:inner membrane protein